MPNLLEGLNDEQQAAVTHGEGPLMIVAGAGTGKTTVITRRIAWLIEEGKAKQDEILALTFTEKAASEMEERVDKLLPIGYLDLWISTFHGFCERVLRAHALDIGLPNTFTLVTEVDAWLLVRRNLDKFNLDYFKPRGTPTKFIEAMLQHFSRAKDEGITPEMYLDKVSNMQPSETDDEAVLEQKKWSELASAYQTYQTLLLDNGSLDFGDLIAYTIELFRTRPNILKKFQEQFRYVVVDEFQDTNSAQYELVKLLAGSRRNITVVGDDDQAIYRFRGAALANILNFRSDFPDTARVVLTHNYRSGKHILDHSYKLIQNNNPHRLEATESLSKQLIAANGTDGFVHHLHAATLTDEVQQTVETIVALHGQGCAWSDMAILVRANDAADPFILELEQAGVPYRFIALSGLYQKPIILDALSYMRVIDQPHDGPSLYRVLSHPRLGLNEADVIEITLHGKKRGMTLYRALESASMLPRVSLEGKQRALELIDELEKLRRSAKRLPVTELFVEILKQTGLLGDITRLVEREQKEQYSYLQSFLERLRRFAQSVPDKSLHAFLEEFAHERASGSAGSLPVDTEEGPDVVSIMTVHAAKGLEFKFVFVVNLVEQRFPSQSRGSALSFPAGLMHSDEWSSEEHHREERRLFYVAMTRAKEGLYLMSAKDYGGARYKKPSRFLVELGFIDPAQIVSKKEAELSLPNGKKTDSRPILHKIPDKLSFTQITAFAKCPLQYKFAHVLNVPIFGRYQMSFGKSMHNALQRYMERLIPQVVPPQITLFDAPAAVQPPTVNELLTMFDECWIDEWYESEEQKEEYRTQGREALKVFHRKVVEEKPVPKYLEKGFTLKVADVCVKGRIDRIDAALDGLEIIDYKTGKPKTLKELGWDERRQLVLYAMAVEQCFPDTPKVVKVTYYYLEDNSTVSFVVRDEDKEHLAEDIREFMSAIADSDFAPTPSQHNCQYCDFKEICEHSAA